MTTTTIRITHGDSFKRTLRFIKGTPGRRYNPADQTWTIPSNARILGLTGWDRTQYRYEVVGDSEATGTDGITRPCPTYDPDQGCPRHGEFCAPA